MDDLIEQQILARVAYINLLDLHIAKCVAHNISITYCISGDGNIVLVEDGAETIIDRNAPPVSLERPLNGEVKWIDM